MGSSATALAIGCIVGTSVVGVADGRAVGTSVTTSAIGCAVGPSVVGVATGRAVGTSVTGELVGRPVGPSVKGEFVGSATGMPEGTSVGSSVIEITVGSSVGTAVAGMPVGRPGGSAVAGISVGRLEGLPVTGARDGRAVGSAVGAGVGVWVSTPPVRAAQRGGTESGPSHPSSAGRSRAFDSTGVPLTPSDPSPRLDTVPRRWRCSRTAVRHPCPCTSNSWGIDRVGQETGRHRGRRRRRRCESRGSGGRFWDPSARGPGSRIRSTGRRLEDSGRSEARDSGG